MPMDSCDVWWVRDAKWTHSTALGWTWEILRLVGNCMTAIAVVVCAAVEGGYVAARVTLIHSILVAVLVAFVHPFVHAHSRFLYETALLAHDSLEVNLLICRTVYSAA